MQNFLIVAQQVAVLFMLMGVGVVCRRTKLVDESSVRGMVNLLILIVTPCLIVDCFQRDFDPSMLRGLALAFVIAVSTHIVAIAAACLCVRHWADSTQRVLRVAAVFSNAGFMGIPLEQAVLGDEGVFFGVVYVAVFNLFMWSWGYGTMRNDGRRSFFNRTMFVNPGTIGLAMGLPLFFFSVRLPAFVQAPVHGLASLNTPLAMLVIGFYLAGARLGAALRMRMLHVAAALRLLVLPLLLLAALYPFRGSLNRTMMLALVTAASSPVAAMVSMFAAKFDRDVDASVGLVSGTTLASILTMPFVIALAMSLL